MAVVVLVYGALIVTLLAAAPMVWVALVMMRVSRMPILPREPRRTVPWGLVDLLLGFVLLVGLSAVGLQLFPLDRQPEPAAQRDREDDGDETAPASAERLPPAAEKKSRLETLSLADARKIISLDSGVKLVVAALLIAAIGLRLGPSATDWGWTLAHWRRDLTLGVGVFLATFAPMIGLQAALVYGLSWKYEHPMIDLVTRTKDPLLFGLSAVAAAVIAPLFEEFIFRGLLQGWLEKVVAGRSGAKSVLLGGDDDPQPGEPAPVAAIDVPGYATAPEPIDLNPYAAPQPVEASLPPASAAGLVPATRLDWLAIFCSMLVFSLLHFSHGPAWIPLLIFGAAVGLVYQRTHRLWPGIIAHMLLNGTTILGLWIQVFVGLPK